MRNMRNAYTIFVTPWAASLPPLRPGAKTALVELTPHYRLAVASSGQIAHVRQALARLDISQFFEVVVGGDNVSHGKPAPDIYLHAVAQLGCEVVDCIAVEDSPNGIMSALNAGLTTVAVPDSQFMPPTELLAQCVLVTTSLTDFASLILVKFGSHSI